MENIRLKDLKHKTTEDRLEELGKIKYNNRNIDLRNTEDLLYYIAEELTLLNINNRRK